MQVAFQLLIYPMIDDRNVTPASYAITDPRVWHRESNRLGWKAYLGRDGGGDDVSPYAAAARGDGESGRITVLVSHRFSTVRMADLIVVLDGARLVEVGTHDELMARSGQYAQLYGIQAAAYR